MSSPIVNIQSMGDAFRNTGYKNLESAISEIVDNSIEAGAKDVLIILDETIGQTGRKVVKDIAILDNGGGMDQQTLNMCLGIGSTTRQARKGMGRFGVGLPQASLYATPHVEVFSWQDGSDRAKWTYLDIDEVKMGEQKDIPAPIYRPLPEFIQKYLTYKTEEKELNFEDSGTLVVWKDCDRLTPKTAPAIANRVTKILGTKFRHYIHNGKVQIQVVYGGKMNPIYPRDPLLLMDKSQIMGKVDNPGKLYTYQDEGAVPVFRPFSEGTDTDDGIIETEIEYFGKNGEKKSGKVKLQFSIVKNEFYDATAIPDKNPGDTQIGKNITDLAGISVVRAGREIDFGDFDYFSSVNNPNNRWWGCEISFEPDLDEAFGVSNNKQHVELHDPDKSNIEYSQIVDEDVQPVWNQLYKLVHGTISKMNKQNRETRKGTRTPVGPDTPDLPPVSISEKVVDHVEEYQDGKAEKDAASLSVEQRNSIIKDGLERYGQQPTPQNIQFWKDKKINIIYKANGQTPHPAFDIEYIAGVVVLVINTDSDFYKYFESVFEENLDARTAFELLLASFAMAKNQSDINEQSLKNSAKLLSKWQRKLDDYIERWDEEN